MEQTVFTVRTADVEEDNDTSDDQDSNDYKWQSNGKCNCWRWTYNE